MLHNPIGCLTILTAAVPLRGAFVSIDRSTVQNFSIPATQDYTFPQGYASCLTNLGGTPVYLQTGGLYYDMKGPIQGVRRVEAGFVAVPLQLGKQVQPMLNVAGAAGAQGTVYSALSCSPDGVVYSFGGLQISRYNEVPIDTNYDDKPDSTFPEPEWAVSNSLTVATLSGSPTAPTLSTLQKLGPAPTANMSVNSPILPTPRNGHTLTYLPPQTVEFLGFSKGALLLYGGSNVTVPSLSVALANETQTAEVLADTEFDRRVWMFDLGTSKWVKLHADGLSDAPPGLMYHSAAVEGKQVGQGLLWYGQTCSLSTHVRAVEISRTRSPFLKLMSGCNWK